MRPDGQEFAEAIRDARAARRREVNVDHQRSQPEHTFGNTVERIGDMQLGDACE
jgi:hypothetical protein